MGTRVEESELAKLGATEISRKLVALSRQAGVALQGVPVWDEAGWLPGAKHHCVTVESPQGSKFIILSTEEVIAYAQGVEVSRAVVNRELQWLIAQLAGDKK